MADKIDGQPGVMESVYGPGGFFQGKVVNGDVNAIKSVDDATERTTYGLSQMMEGQAFYEQDGVATYTLQKFLHDTDMGFDAFRNRASDDAYHYLAADANGATFIEDVSRNIIR